MSSGCASRRQRGRRRLPRQRRSAAQPPQRFHIFDLVQHQCLGLCESESRETHEKFLHHCLSNDILRAGGKKCSFGLIRQSAPWLRELLDARVTHSRNGLDPERRVAVQSRSLGSFCRCRSCCSRANTATSRSSRCSSERRAGSRAGGGIHAQWRSP
jgi:hypothetical protein